MAMASFPRRAALALCAAAFLNVSTSHAMGILGDSGVEAVWPEVSASVDGSAWTPLNAFAEGRWERSVFMLRGRLFDPRFGSLKLSAALPKKAFFHDAPPCGELPPAPGRGLSAPIELVAHDFAASSATGARTGPRPQWHQPMTATVCRLPSGKPKAVVWGRMVPLAGADGVAPMVVFHAAGEAPPPEKR